MSLKPQWMTLVFLTGSVGKSVMTQRVHFTSNNTCNWSTT